MFVKANNCTTTPNLQITISVLFTTFHIACWSPYIKIDQRKILITITQANVGVEGGGIHRWNQKNRYTISPNRSRKKISDFVLVR